jgi:hypothetical protein
LFRHLVALVYLGVAGEAEGGNPIVMRFKPSAFAILQLVGMGGNNRPILYTAYLTGRLPYYF